MKLTLLHKGLILVCIPLCFEILVFSYLISAQNHLEIEAQKINRNKKINDQVNLILADMIGVVESARPTRSGTDRPSLVPTRAISTIADVSKRFDELEVLSQDEPEMLKNIQEGKSEVHLAIEALTGLKTQLRSAEPEDVEQIVHDASLNGEMHLQKLVTVGMFDWATKNKIERELLRKEIWEQIRIVLKFGLFLSLILGIAGSYLLSRQLVRRVSRLAENAALMGNGKPLLPLLDGTDELAELDRNFHQAANLLEAAKRMRQEVTAMITHDLRTPLQTVLGFLEMCGESRFGEFNESGKRLLSIVLNTCNHMSRLIDNILQLEKLRSGAIKLTTSQVELNSFIEKCISSVEFAAEEKAIAIAFAPNQADKKLVEIDPFWLEQVVVNILSNAIKYSPASSSITISTLHSTHTSIIRIADQGPGIPADEQKLIFERFHRMKSTAAVPGTGLGLAIAKELVELHGGSIGVESTEGHGATFVLTLPVSKTAAAAAQRKVSKVRDAEFHADSNYANNTDEDRKNEDRKNTDRNDIDRNDIDRKDENRKDETHSTLNPAKKPVLKLLHKGLILISIPLCFEVTIFGVLLNLQDQVEQEANRIDHSSQVNDAANRILRDTMLVGFGLRQHQRKHDWYQTSDSQFRLWFEDILQNLRKLEKLVENEDMENQVKRGEHGIKLLAERLMLNTKSSQGQEELISELLSMMSYLAKRSITSEFDLHDSELRAQSRMLLNIALLMSVIFSGLGAIWYSRQIAVRLRKLGENAKLLALGEPLLEPVRGTDEIAALDASFHSAAAQIEAANKIRQEATVMITHDLKTPLQSFRSFSEMMEMGAFGDINEGGHNLLSSSRRSAQRMEDLINSVLQLEALRSGRLKLQTTQIALAPLLDKCLASIKVLADQKHIAITHDYGNLETETVDGDAFWLEQVFVNIISNAIKFSSNDSTVSVTLKKSDKQIEILVADRGMGISAENQKLIFERYQRPESVALIGGTGLGLPIAKELIELHHGSIAVESSVGEGSTFKINLPSADQA